MDEADGRDSWVYVGLEYIVEVIDGGAVIVTDCALRETHLASRMDWQWVATTLIRKADEERQTEEGLPRLLFP